MINIIFYDKINKIINNILKLVLHFLGHNFEKIGNLKNKITTILFECKNKVNFLVEENSYSSLTHYNAEKRYFFEKYLYNLIENINTKSFIDEYEKNISSFESYSNIDNSKNDIVNNIDEKFINDFLYFLEDNSTLIDINKLIYILLKNKNNNFHQKILENMKQNSFFKSSFILDNEKDYEKNILDFFKDNIYKLGKGINILYENNKFYLKVIIEEQVFSEGHELIEDNFLSNQNIIYNENNGKSQIIREITNMELLTSIFNSREKIKSKGIKYDYLINTHLNYTYRLKNGLENSRENIYPVDGYIDKLIKIDAIKKGKKYEYDKNIIEEFNYFNYEIEKFLKGDFLSLNEINFRKLFLSNNFNQSFKRKNIEKFKFTNLDLEKRYIKEFCTSLYLKIGTEKRNNFIEKLKSKKSKNSIEKSILDFLNLNNIEKIIKDEYSFDFDINKFAKHSIDIFDVNPKMKKNLDSAERFIQKNIIPNNKNFIVDNISLFNDLNNLYLLNYPEQKKFTDYIEKNLYDLIFNKKYETIYVLERTGVALISMYIQKINEETIYIGGLYSNDFLKVGFDFAKDRVLTEGKTKNIEIIVYTEIENKKNRYKTLTKAYKGMGFEIIDKEGNIFKENINEENIEELLFYIDKKNKSLGTYIKMRRPKDKD